MPDYPQIGQEFIDGHWEPSKAANRAVRQAVESVDAQTLTLAVLTVISQDLARVARLLDPRHRLATKRAAKEEAERAAQEAPSKEGWKRYLAWRECREQELRSRLKLHFGRISDWRLYFDALLAAINLSWSTARDDLSLTTPEHLEAMTVVFQTSLAGEWWKEVRLGPKTRARLEAKLAAVENLRAR